MSSAVHFTRRPTSAEVHLSGRWHGPSIAARHPSVATRQSCAIARAACAAHARALRGTSIPTVGRTGARLQLPLACRGCSIGRPERRWRRTGGNDGDWARMIGQDEVHRRGGSPRRWAVRSTYGRVSKVRYAPGRPTWIDKVPDRHSGMGAVRLDGARQGWRKCLSQIENARFARVNVGSIERPFQSSAHGSHDKAVMAPYAWLAANRAGELGLPVRRVGLEGAGCRRFGSDASGCSCSAPESRSDLLRWRAGCVPGGRGRTSMFG